MLGDFDLFEYEGVDVNYVEAANKTWVPVDPDPSDNFFMAQAIFVPTSFIINIILLNMLIGLLGASFDRHQEIAGAYFNRERAGALLEMAQNPLYIMLGSAF